MISVSDEAASARRRKTHKLDDHVDVANSKRCEHGGALRHEASLLQRGGYCGATEAGKEAGLCGGRGPSKAASWSACYYLQMWLVVINNEHLVRARPHSQVLVSIPGSALGYL